jgi:hypothetical protein
MNGANEMQPARSIGVQNDALGIGGIHTARPFERFSGSWIIDYKKTFLSDYFL